MKEQNNNDYLHDSISLYIYCLGAISQNLIKLSQKEKECYYSEVKNLIQIIKIKQLEFEANAREMRIDED
jgi:hypothetical protein